MSATRQRSKGQCPLDAQMEELEAKAAWLGLKVAELRWEDPLSVSEWIRASEDFKRARAATVSKLWVMKGLTEKERRAAWGKITRLARDRGGNSQTVL